MRAPTTRVSDNGMCNGINNAASSGDTSAWEARNHTQIVLSAIELSESTTERIAGVHSVASSNAMHSIYINTIPLSTASNCCTALREGGACEIRAACIWNAPFTFPHSATYHTLKSGRSKACYKLIPVVTAGTQLACPVRLK